MGRGQTEALRQRFPELAGDGAGEGDEGAGCGLRVVYVGDGGNDVCPCVRLLGRRRNGHGSSGGGDLALPRAGFALASQLSALGNEGGLACEVQEWRDWGELAAKLKGLANGASEIKD